MVTRKRRIAIVYTRVPAFATPLRHFFGVIFWPHRNRISPVGRHQEARQLLSLVLHGIESVNIYDGMFYNERRTLTSHCSRPPNPTTNICHQRASERRYAGINIQGQPGRGNGGEASAVQKYGQTYATLSAELFETLLAIDAVCKFSLTYN